MKLAAAALALAVLPALPACVGDDDGGDPDETWRLPCASTITWTPGDAVEHRVFRYDGRHLVELTETSAVGEVTYHVLRGWVGEHVAWSEVTTLSTETRTEYTYDQAGRVVRTVQIDRELADGDDDGYTIDYAYDGGGALIAASYDYRNPDWPDRESVITGNLTPREVWTDCVAGTTTECDVYVYEQADRDPAHWTLGTADYGSDGAIDFRWTRRLDVHGLELYFDETDVNAGVFTYRSSTRRDDDGTELEERTEFFNAIDRTTPSSISIERNQFSCAAKVANAGAGADHARAGAMQLRTMVRDDAEPVARPHLRVAPR